MSLPEADGPGNARPVESLKRSIMLALRDAIDANLPSGDTLRRVIENVVLEYPSKQTSYPGLWINFSFTSLRRAGLVPEFRTSEGRRFMLWAFEARVTVNIVALTSLERDRLADAVVEMLAFGDLSPAGRVFWDKLSDQPGIWFNANKDEITPNGQTVTIGTPWLDDQLAYEDAYSFNLSGQFGSDLETGQTTILREITWEDHIYTGDVPPALDTSDGNGTWV
jgi:hypothetical protein